MTRTAWMILLSVMLFSLVIGAIPVPSAKAQDSGASNLSLIPEELVGNLGKDLYDGCGVTFEFLPDGRIICGELRTGKVMLIVNNTLVPEPLIDLDVANGWKMPGVIDEQGLIGLAIDPNFKDNGYVYLHYTYYTDAATNSTAKRVSRFTMVNDKLVDEKVLIEGIPGAKQHVGGPIEFGPDGKLYITGGEAGRRARADDLKSPLGKILRINPDGTIPPDNPFPGEPYYTIGHRNSFGLTFHPITGRPYITENGNDTNDEINILYPGKNYGWPNVNGTTNDPRYISPLYATGPGTIAPTEAEFYTGDKYPSEFKNNLFFLAYNTRSLDRIELVGPDYDILKSFTSYPLPAAWPSFTDIELGPDGYFYVSDFKTIYRVLFERTNVTSSVSVKVPPSAESALPTEISATLIDDSGNPIAGVPLVLAVADGPDLTENTDDSGTATFQYTPFSAGEFPVTARFTGNQKFAPSISGEVRLKVEGPSTLPPRELEARTEDNFVVRLTLLPTSDDGNNSTIKFAVKILDPRSQTEVAGIPYHVEILRGGSVLYSHDDVTEAGLSLQEYVFEDMGAAEFVVRDINNSENSATFSINVVPEFPAHLALAPLAGFAIVILVASRYGKRLYRSW